MVCLNESNFLGRKFRCKICGWRTSNSRPYRRNIYFPLNGLKIHMAHRHHIKLMHRFFYAQKHQGHLFELLPDSMAGQNTPGSFSLHKPPSRAELFKGYDITNRAEIARVNK